METHAANAGYLGEEFKQIGSHVFGFIVLNPVGGILEQYQLAVLTIIYAQARYAVT